jgi:hypothetical protein
MVIGIAARRAGRTSRIEALFGKDQAAAALDLLELTELAWHDRHGEVTPPAAVVDDILCVSQGGLSELVRAARMAVEDFRDLRLAADGLRQADA